MKFTFAHNNFNVTDLDKSLKFYEEALGLKVVRRKEAADEDCAVSLAERGYDVSYGARPLRRLIRSEVEDALATCLLDGTLASGDTAVLAAENGTLCVRRREKAAAAALGDVGARKA